MNCLIELFQNGYGFLCPGSPNLESLLEFLRLNSVCLESLCPETLRYLLGLGFAIPGLCLKKIVVRYCPWGSL